MAQMKLMTKTRQTFCLASEAFILNIVQGKTRSLNYLESNIVCDKDTDDDNGKLTPPYSQTASRVHVLLIAGYFSAIFSILSYNKMR